MPIRITNASPGLTLLNSPGMGPYRSSAAMAMSQMQLSGMGAPYRRRRQAGPSYMARARGARAQTQAGMTGHYETQIGRTLQGVDPQTLTGASYRRFADISDAFRNAQQVEDPQERARMMTRIYRNLRKTPLNASQL